MLGNSKFDFSVYPKFNPDSAYSVTEYSFGLVKIRQVGLLLAYLYLLDTILKLDHT